MSYKVIWHYIWDYLSKSSLILKILIYIILIFRGPIIGKQNVNCKISLVRSTSKFVLYETRWRQSDTMI